MKTTDNQNEIFDVVNEQDEVIGQATRFECNHNPKIIHRVAYVMIVNNLGELFAQKRSKSKDTFPGLWTSSTSGHVDSGETYLQAAVRECYEELGIHIKEDQLTKIGKFLCRMPQEQEYVTVFKLFHNGPFVLSANEVESGEWFSPEEFIALEGTPPFCMLVKHSMMQHLTV